MGMATLKRLLVFIFAGAFLGAIIASLIAPNAIGWYNEPAFAVPTGFNLRPFADAVMASLLKAQVIGAAIGAIILLSIGIALRQSKSGKTTPPANTEATPAKPPVNV